MDDFELLKKEAQKSPTKLSRAGRLQWFDEPSSWQERWFEICAKRNTFLDLIDSFWQRIGIACIDSICHIASTDENNPHDCEQIVQIALPEQASEWLEAAPPMPGGEFLNLEMLQILWDKLLAYCASLCQKAGGITNFLKAQAPEWVHVGRIFFHLAENKMDPTYPFAFLATYTVGLNEKGQPKHLPLNHAAKFYQQNNDKMGLRRLLEPLARAEESFPWVKKMCEQKTIFQARPWLPNQAYLFLKSVEGLEKIGIGIRLPNWWKKRSKPQIKATFNSQEGGGRLGANSLVSIDLKVAIGDQECSPKELEEILRQCSDGLVLLKGQWVEIDKEKLQQALNFWKEAEIQAAEGGLTFSQGLRLMAGVPLTNKEIDLEEEVRSWSLT
ncbi:MAG: SNF2 helicase-associated domain-containing protein, partial [Desulfovibrionaceae bacterium]|nr:SNF2 helicase-associated domain-containing protein [Desulfovibrionaceae bacterium]